MFDADECIATIPLKERMIPMTHDLQKASLWKRASAWIFDFILLGILIVGVALVLSAVLGYNGYNETLDAAYATYEEQYGVEFEISQEQYHTMTEQQRQNYNDAYDALVSDQEAMYAYNMVLNLTMLITTVSILISYLLLEFALPLYLGNGQTLGKKIFGLCLMRIDGVQINTMQLFVRTVLGKFTIETMIPVYILIMIFFNMIGIVGTGILAVLVLVQIILLAVTATNAQIHDLLAGTVVVDYASQMIFRTTEDLIAYQKRVAAEAAARQSY